MSSHGSRVDTLIEKNREVVFTVVRVVFGGLFALHGAMKFGVFGGPSMVGAPLVLAAASIELLCGLLIVAGLFGRWAAFLASGEMAVAYFHGHASGGLNPLTNKGELAVLYCFFFLYVFARGVGPHSLDGLRARRR